MASSCSQETSPGRAQAAGLSSMLGGGGGVPRPLPARQRPVGAWRRPSSCSGRRSPSTPLADLCGRPGGSPCSRRLLRGACHNRHTLPGDKAPGWQGQAAIAAEPETPRPLLPDSQPGLRPRQKRALLPFLSETASWNLHPLGFAIFTHPEPSGLHGDASKQQIPGSNDVTFPFPAAQAWRHCSPGLGSGLPAPPARPKAPGPQLAGTGAFLGRELLPAPGAAVIGPRAEHRAREPPALPPPCSGSQPCWLPGGGGRAGGHRAGCWGSGLSGLGSPRALASEMVTVAGV